MSVMTINLTAVSSRRPPKWRKLLAELPNVPVPATS